MRKVGVWRGKVERPSEYCARIQREMAAAWEAAKRRAPGGCPIRAASSWPQILRAPGTVIAAFEPAAESGGSAAKKALAAGWKRSPGHNVRS